MTDRPVVIGNEMEQNECESFLTSIGHGVLSMGMENRGYGVPVSFGYDEESNRIILEFVNAPDSKKQQFAEATEEVTLAVYNYEDIDSWESVIVTGTIEPLEETVVSERFASLFFAQADDAAGHRRWEERDDVERKWHEIQISDVSGRRSEGLHPRR